MASLDYSGATEREITRIEAWLVLILAKVVRSDCPLSEREKSNLMTKLLKVTIKIKDCRRTGPRMKVKGGSYPKITICRDSLNFSLFFRGLVRLIGGIAIDQEALEFHCFGEERELDEDDWREIVEGSRSQAGTVERAGKFVVWNPCTGEKWYNEGNAAHPVKGAQLRRNPPIPADVAEELDIDCP